MKLVVTGGGTGGHVYPALEIALAARDQGHDVAYFGSLRGQEGKACEQENVPFRGLASEPVYSLRTPRGWRSLIRLLQATHEAQKLLRAHRPDVVFATGGYSSAPVIRAARILRIPYVLHEQNTIPGRSTRLWCQEAFAVGLVFASAASHFPGARTERVGMPIRRQLRSSAQGRLNFDQPLPGSVPTLLVVGGSQGAVALNDVALATAVRMAREPLHWLHVTGHGHFDATMKSLAKLGLGEHYDVKSYLDAGAMATAYFGASLVICRAGAGTMAELAAFRKPSILVPYPHSFADHQRKNAEEFEAMGASLMIDQEALDASTLESRIRLWIHESDRSERAATALAEWDVPDSITRIMTLLESASKS